MMNNILFQRTTYKDVKIVKLQKDKIFSLYTTEIIHVLQKQV